MSMAIGYHLSILVWPTWGKACVTPVSHVYMKIKPLYDHTFHAVCQFHLLEAVTTVIPLDEECTSDVEIP